MGSPYSEQMNLSIQHEVRNILFEVGYVGNMGHRLNAGSVTPELCTRSALRALVSLG